MTIDATPGRHAGKRIVVTGAAGGIGAAAARRLAAEGATVLCADLHVDGANETADQIVADGGEAHAAAVDVSESDSARGLVRDAVDRLGGLDVLCNIAGIGHATHFADETDSGWLRTIAVNLNGIFFTSHEALPHLREGGGNIVNIASTAGMIGQAYVAAYCASKHGVVGLTRALAIEFARKGVRVNAVCPGGTNTNIIGGFAPPEGANMHLVMRAMLQDELADPADIAAMIAYVASDEARYVNGAVLAVDGGITAG